MADGNKAKSNKVAIKAANLYRKIEGDITAVLVNDVSLEINAGEFIIITGPSGSGKSSLLYLLGLLDKPTGGRVIVNGTDTSGFSDDELASFRLGNLGFVFQFHFLLPEFTALENVMLPMQRRGKLGQGEIKSRAEELLVSFGLKEELHKFPKQMSGGQSQRVAIARALSNSPSIILADEPTGNLDSASSQNVQRILKQLAEENGQTVVVVTHDSSFAASAGRAIHIVDGKVA